MPSADQYFETSDGVRLHYLDVGKGEPLVFVPGWRAPAFIWERQLDFFGRTHRVVALDPRGHGESDETHEGVYRERRAQDIAELLDAASLESAVLIGWSMGVPEVLTYVQHHGAQRVRGVVLVDWPFRFGDDFRQAVGPYLLQFQRNPVEVSRELIPSYFTTPPDQDFLDRLSEATLRVPTTAAVSVLLDYIIEGGDWSETLRDLGCPLLYAVSPEYADAAKAAKDLVPTAVTRVFEGAAHGFFVDQSEDFNRTLSQFVEELE